MMCNWHYCDLEVVKGHVSPCMKNVALSNFSAAPLALQDLTYSVKSHHDKKVTLDLLSSVCGFFNSGEMSALVRPAVS